MSIGPTTYHKWYVRYANQTTNSFFNPFSFLNVEAFFNI